jgi:CDP-6-deoxy-D-xylo-4-hexulose-3-dehydrase
MTSSGSTANLLAIAAMVYSGRLNAGDEILVPAVSWSTTYFPLSQMGLKIRLVDVNRETLNMDLEKAEAAVTERTRGIFAVNLLGNPNDFIALRALCDRHGLILLEDNCESMGASLDGKKAGTFGVIGTFSSFFSHHIATMEGGFAVTDDEELYQYMLAIRAHGWTRNLPENSVLHVKNENPFYESFCFVVPGFNLRPLEMEGALAVEQLKKLGGFIEQRRRNADYFKATVGTDARFYMQRETGRSSWFGFALILRNADTVMRDKVVDCLRSHGIETRPIVAGNFARQPVFARLDASVSGKLENADYIHDNGFFVGNHSIDMHEQIDYLKSVLDEMC